MLQLLISVVEAGSLSSVFFLLASFADFFLPLSLVFCCSLLAVEVVHSRDEVPDVDDLDVDVSGIVE